MLTFLRKIRKSLIDTGATRKYILYAIGEITLVVIGILIALQFNTRHQHNLNKQKIEKLFEEVLHDLDQDISDMTSQIERYKKKTSWSRKVLSNELDKSDYENQEYVHLITYNFEPIQFKTKAFDRLLHNIELIPDEYIYLVEQLQEAYHEEANAIGEVEKELREFMIMVYNEYRNSFDWYSNSESGHHSERINYHLTSPKYKNDVHRYQQIVRHLNAHFNGFYRDATISYNQIFKKLNLEIPFSRDVKNMHSLSTEKLMEYEGLYDDGSEKITIEINDEGLLRAFNRMVLFNENQDTFVSSGLDTLIFGRGSAGFVCELTEIYTDTIFNSIRIEE